MEDRDFIDFEFNGHWASEFNLLAVSNSDRYSNSFYGTVNANTADMVGKYGVYKWKTQIGEKRFSINIAYDNVDLNTLRKIKEWLNPFVIGKLVFKEEPYKYYWVSLAEDPEISFLPFLTEETVVDGRRLKKGVYKGEFVINFVCFDNYGYSDWNSFDENYDYIVKELEISDDEVNFDDGSDNNLIISQIDGNLKQNKESQVYYSTSQESNSLTLNNITNTDTEKWNIKGGNSQVVQNYSSIQVEGESFDLNDVDNSKTMDIQLKGNHSQETREGYNLLDFNVRQDSKVTVNEDGTITINGSGGFDIKFKEFVYKKGVTYKTKATLVSGTYISADPNHMGIMTPYRANEWLANNIFRSYTFLENEVRSTMWTDAACVFNNATFELYCYEGTEEKPYEQYGASPSPDFPSEIKSVGGNENLFNYEMELGGYSGTTGAKYDSGTRIRNKEPFALNTGIYTLSCQNATIISINKVGGGKEQSVNSDKITFTLNEQQNCIVTIETFDLLNAKIKLEKGSNATSYSPYGQGSVEIDVVNKNLLNKNLIKRNASCRYGNIGLVPIVEINLKNRGTLTHQNAIKIKPNTTYVLTVPKGIRFAIAQLESDLKSLGDTGWLLSTASPYTLTTQHNAKYIGFNFGKDDNSNFTDSEWDSFLNGHLQLEAGTIATDFIEHQEQVITMPVQQEMLEGDYISNVEHHEWGKIVLTENSDIECTHNNKTFQFKFLKHLEDTGATTKVICNMAKYWNIGAWGENGCFISWDGYFYILCKENEFGFNVNMTTDEAIAHFKTILANSKLIAYYKLAEPINLELTSEQKTAAKQFKAITPYKNITHIYSTDEIAPKMVVDYNITRAMPSPDYPSEIKAVKDSVEVKVVNKNFVKIDETIDFSISNVQFTCKDGKLNLNGTSNKNISSVNNNFKNYFRFILPAGNYTYSQKNSVSSNIFTYILDFEDTSKRYATANGNSVKNASFTLEKTTEVFVGVYSGSNVTFNNVKIELQLEKGSTATYFNEHQEQAITMPVQQDMLDGDYFDFDREKEVHIWNKEECNGSEKWIQQQTTSAGYWYIHDINGKGTSGDVAENILCNKFKSITGMEAWKGVEGICVQNNIAIFLEDYSQNKTLDEFKSFIKENPFVVYYKMKNLIELPFTNEQKTVARQLKRSNFYKGTTNVILDNDLAKVKVNYDGYDGAPSEKHPSSVDGVKDSVEITVKNKNILPIPNSSNTSMGLTSTYSNGVYQITGTPVTNWTLLFQKIKQPIKKGKYTLSYEVEGEKYQLEPTFIYKNGEIERKWIQPSIKKQTIDLKDDVESLTLGLSGFTSNQAVNITLKIQLERGEEATEIVVPEQQKVSLPVQEEVYIGDYIDETGEHHKMTKIVIDGTNTRVSMTKKSLNNYIQTYLNTSEQFNPQVDTNCYSNIMNQEYNGRFGFINTFIKSKTGIYFHFKGDLLGDADCNDIGMNNWFKEQYDKGTPAYIIGPLKKEKVLPLTDEQKSALNILKNYTYSYPGANTISISGDTKPKITASYIPQQDINIDFVLEGSNLLNDSAFYYNNDIYLKAFDEIDSGNPSTSGISSEREVYLYNAGNADASLKLTFDLIIPVENSPLTIVTSKGHFTKNGFEEINNYSQFSISNFAHYKPFVDIFDGVLSNWVIEIDSDLCEVYLKHKTNKDKVISLNRFNDNQSFLKLAGSDFVDYSKSFPTSLEEIKDSAIENTIFNKISLKESAQNYRLKNVSLDWKHTYL